MYSEQDASSHQLRIQVAHYANENQHPGTRTERENGQLAFSLFS